MVLLIDVWESLRMSRMASESSNRRHMFDALPPDVRNELAGFEAALKADPTDASAWLEEAAAYDRHKMEPNALFAYRKVADIWKDATWVRGRIFELEESLANQAALKAAEIAPDAKVYAMLVGISKYEKLPQDEWLQFSDADAKSFAQELASPRAGSVPLDQLLVLTNEQATTAAIGLVGERLAAREIEAKPR